MNWLFKSFIDFELREQYHVEGAHRQSSLMGIFVGSFAAVGGFLYGYDTGLSNNILSMDYVIQHFSSNGFTAQQRAIATGSLSLGTLFGAISSPLLCDNIGRKFSIMIASLVIFNIGNICQLCSTGLVLLCIGRFITGSAIGVLSVAVPLYQSEASPKWIRGAIVSTYQWAITWGLLCSSAISQGTRNLQNSGSYRIPIGLQSGWALILSFGLIFLPESPRYYVLKDKLPQAARSLSILRKVPYNDPGLIEELVDIKAAHDYTSNLSRSFIGCFKATPSNRKLKLRMLTGVLLQAFQQATGINFIFYYGVFFFVKTGVVQQSYLFSLITYAVNVVSTIPSFFFIEYFGRRKSLIFGGAGMSVSLFIVAIVGVTKVDSMVANKVMLALVCVFIFCFALTWGPGVWVVSSEIFPLSIRGRAVSICASSNWLVNFAFAYASPYLIGGDNSNHGTVELGSKIFFLWGGLSFLGTIFAYFLVYETKGLKLEEINEMYSTCKNPMSSAKFKPSESRTEHDNEVRHDIEHKMMCDDSEVDTNCQNSNDKLEPSQGECTDTAGDTAVSGMNYSANNNENSNKIVSASSIGLNTSCAADVKPTSTHLSNLDVSKAESHSADRSDVGTSSYSFSVDHNRNFVAANRPPSLTSSEEEYEDDDLSIPEHDIMHADLREIVNHLQSSQYSSRNLAFSNSLHLADSFPSYYENGNSTGHSDSDNSSVNNPSR